MVRRYNHLYVVAFSADSDDPQGGSADEILSALGDRLRELHLTGEVLEAVGLPEDTFDQETGATLEPE